MASAEQGSVWGSINKSHAEQVGLAQLILALALKYSASWRIRSTRGAKQAHRVSIGYISKCQVHWRITAPIPIYTDPFEDGRPEEHGLGSWKRVGRAG